VAARCAWERRRVADGVRQAAGRAWRQETEMDLRNEVRLKDSTYLYGLNLQVGLEAGRRDLLAGLEARGENFTGGR
jgi:hypothetical protein